MDEYTDILLPILSWAWVALVAVMVWFFKRLHKVQGTCSDYEKSILADIQERRGIVNTAVAVLKSSQEDLRQEFDKDAKRNAVDHQRILDSIDKNHDRVMDRLDMLTKVVKNGG